MTSSQPRIPNLPREEWTDDAREVFAFWGEPNSWEEGSRTNIMMVLANHPAMAIPYSHWSKHLLITNTLETRQLEMLILRVAWRVKSEYEWHNHVGYGLNCGMTMDEIAAIRDYPSSADKWEEKERLILAAVDELMDDNIISDATWAGLSKHYDRRQMMDLVMSIGHYVMTSWAISSFGVPIEGDVDPVGFDLNTGSGEGPRGRFKPGEVDGWSDKNRS